MWRHSVQDGCRVETAATYKDGLKAEQSVDEIAVKTEQGIEETVDEFTAVSVTEVADQEKVQKAEINEKKIM